MNHDDKCFHGQPLDGDCPDCEEREMMKKPGGDPWKAMRRVVKARDETLLNKAAPDMLKALESACNSRTGIDGRWDKQSCDNCDGRLRCQLRPAILKAKGE